MDEAADLEPAIDFHVYGGKVDITYQRVREVTINFYVSLSLLILLRLYVLFVKKMDIELLFSINPTSFASGNGSGSSSSSSFTYVAPTERLKVKLPKQKNSFAPGRYEVSIPEILKNCNVYVEVVGGSQTLTESKPYYDNQLFCQVKESFGQVRVLNRDTLEPVPKAYVKCYRQVYGDVEFHKVWIFSLFKIRFGKFVS